MGKIPRRKPCHWTERDLETLNVDLQAVRECTDERDFFGSEEATLELAGVSLVELEYLINSPLMRSSTDALDVDTKDLHDTAWLNREKDDGRKLTCDYVAFVVHVRHLLIHPAAFKRRAKRSRGCDSDEEALQTSVVMVDSEVDEDSEVEKFSYEVDDEMLCHVSQTCICELMRLIEGGTLYGLYQVKHWPRKHFSFKITQGFTVDVIRPHRYALVAGSGTSLPAIVSLLGRILKPSLALKWMAAVSLARQKVKTILLCARWRNSLSLPFGQPKRSRNIKLVSLPSRDT